MPRFSANLGFLFTEYSEIERVAAAAAAGFKAVEMHWPYQVPAAEMRSALSRSQFEQALNQAVSYGHAIGATAVHCMSGLVHADSVSVAERAFVANLKLAADRAAQAKHGPTAPGGWNERGSRRW